MRFEITPEQLEQIDKWLEEIKPERLAICPPHPIFCPNEPYTGAIGGGLSFRFTPTSIGVAVVAIDGITKKELNVTDYDSW